MAEGHHKVGTRSAHFHRAQVLKAKSLARFQRVTAKIHILKIHHVKGKHLGKELASLTELIEEAIEEARRRLQEEMHDQRYEQMRQLDAVKQQMQNMLDSLPPSYSELEEWEKLKKLLQRSGQQDEKSTFARGTQMLGKARTEVQQGEVKRWVEKADAKVQTVEPKVTHNRISERQQGESGAGTGDGKGHDSQQRQREGESAAPVSAKSGAKSAAKSPDEKPPEVGAPGRLSFHTVCDDVRRKKRRGEEVEPADVELVADRAFVLMQQLREQLSPSWKPEEIPRWISSGDKYVFDLALAAVPKELFEQTNAFQGIQDLRKQQQVFTLRAEDRTAEAARRG